MAGSSQVFRRKSEKLMLRVLATADLKERTSLIAQMVAWHLKALAAASDTDTNGH
jgi:hypothetical protein